MSLDDRLVQRWVEFRRQRHRPRLLAEEREVREAIADIEADAIGSDAEAGGLGKRERLEQSLAELDRSIAEAEAEASRRVAAILDRFGAYLATTEDARLGEALAAASTFFQEAAGHADDLSPRQVGTFLESDRLAEAFRARLRAKVAESIKLADGSSEYLDRAAVARSQADSIRLEVADRERALAEDHGVEPQVIKALPDLARDAGFATLCEWLASEAKQDAPGGSMEDVWKGFRTPGVKETSS